MSEKDENFDVSQFDWVKLKQDMDTQAPVGYETQSQKFMRKLRENPFVPIGAGLTTVCLSYGLYSFKTGKKQMSQLMMRSRVVAQGFTVFALVLGLGMGLHSK